MEKSNLHNAVKRDAAGLDTMSRERVASIATTVLAAPAGSSRCLWMETRPNTMRGCGAGLRALLHHPSGVLSYLMDAEEGGKRRKKKKGGKGKQNRCSAHPKRPDRAEPGGFKGADVRIGCRYSLSPLAAAASRFAPTTPTCFPSIKATATASQRRRQGPLSRDHGALEWLQSAGRETHHLRQMFFISW